MNWTRAYEILDSLYPMPKPRREKCKALFEHAQDVREGCIVELGTWHGCGAIALALGAPRGIKVFAVDDYGTRKGWANEPYIPEDEKIFHANCGKAGVDVTLVKQPVEHACKEWFAPIGLLHWDLGMFSGMLRDFHNWAPFVLKGGKLLMHDTGDRKLGSVHTAEHAIQTRRFREPRHVGGGLWMFEKRPNIVVCAGMSRSGGTVQYLITRTLLERSGIGRGTGHGQHVVDPEPGVVAFKSEAPKDWIVDMVRNEQADVIGIFRDPRDVAASLQEWMAAREEFRQQGLSTDWEAQVGVSLCWQKLWEEFPDTYMARYENCRGNWAKMVSDIANHLGIRTSWEECEMIAKRWSLPEMSKRIQEIIDDDLWMGNEWLLTRAHLGKQRGKIGRWKRDLSKEEAQRVEAVAGKEWMAAHGYRLLDNNG